MSDSLKHHTDANGIDRLSLNRPDVRNAFDDQLIEALTDKLNQLIAEDKTRILVLSGEGKQFCAGADLNWMKKTAEYSLRDNQRDALNLAQMLSLLNEFPAPTVARVQGAALGGGVGLVACCDMAIATEDTQFALSEVKLGLIPATISPFVLGAIGVRAARRFFLTGERFDAQTALHLGLINEVVNTDNLDRVLNEFTDSLLQGGPNAQRSAKKLIREVADKPINPTLERETASRIANIRSTTEGQEGIAAFLQKREPAWWSKND